MQQLVAWWQEREALAAVPPAKLERITFHMDPKWLACIRHEAARTGETQAAVAHRVFAAYFGKK